MKWSPFKLWLFGKYREERHAARQARQARVCADSAGTAVLDNHCIPQRPEPTMSTTWTPSFHGVSHSRTEGKKAYATITDRATWVELSLWFPGCGFNPTKQRHDTVLDAKLAYNEWIKGQA